MRLSQCHTLKELQEFLSKPLFYISNKRRVKRFRKPVRFYLSNFNSESDDIFPNVFDNEDEARSSIPPRPRPPQEALTPLEKKIYNFLGTNGDGYGKNEWMEIGLGREMILKISDRWFDTTNIAFFYRSMEIVCGQSTIPFRPDDSNWNLNEKEKTARKLQIVNMTVNLFEGSKALLKALREIGFKEVVAIDKDEGNPFGDSQNVLCCHLFGKWKLFANCSFVGILNDGKIFEWFSLNWDNIVYGFRKFFAQMTEKGVCLDGRPVLSVIPQGLLKLMELDSSKSKD